MLHIPPLCIKGVYLLELLKSKKLQSTAEKSVAVVEHVCSSSTPARLRVWAQPELHREISRQKNSKQGQKKEEKEGRGEREKQESKQAVGRKPTKAELGKQKTFLWIPRLIFTTSDNILTLLTIHFIRPRLI